MSVVKTFFIKEDEIHIGKINEKLKENFSAIKKNECLKGDLYESNGRVIRYYMNFFEILTFNQRENYEIKSELEKILNIKLVESN
jgi:hypothetical protein